MILSFLTEIFSEHYLMHQSKQTWKMTLYFSYNIDLYSFWDFEIISHKSVSAAGKLNEIQHQTEDILQYSVPNLLLHGVRKKTFLHKNNSFHLVNLA